MLLLILLFAGLVTEILGLHLLFGAFVAGVIMPKTSGFSSRVIERFESLTILLLLPLVFAYTGLRTRIALIHGDVVALPADHYRRRGRKTRRNGLRILPGGMTWRESITLGALMNKRGLVELVVLNIGLDIGIISPTLFSIMVIMVIVTTMMHPLFSAGFIRVPGPRPARDKASNPEALGDDVALDLGRPGVECAAQCVP